MRKRHSLGQYPVPLQFHLRQDFKRTDHFSSPPLLDGGFGEFKDLLNALAVCPCNTKKRHQNIDDQRFNQRQAQDERESNVTRQPQAGEQCSQRQRRQPAPEREMRSITASGNPNPTAIANAAR
jgi:hypothetical protein